MRPDNQDTPIAGMSEADALIERVIASLKWLSETSKNAGLDTYAGFLDQAATNCLEQYVAEQRETLSRSLDLEDSRNRETKT